MPFKNLFIDFRREGETEGKKTSIYCSTYLCIRWLIPLCALTGDLTCNCGVLGQCSNHLSPLARARTNLFIYLLIYL